jgi:hypothetical protein
LWELGFVVVEVEILLEEVVVEVLKQVLEILFVVEQEVVVLVAKVLLLEDELVEEYLLRTMIELMNEMC